MKIPFLNLLKKQNSERTQNKKNILTPQTLGASKTALQPLKVSPSKIKNIFSENDFFAKQNLYSEIETDADIISAIQTRKQAILTLDWQIKSNRSDTPQALEIADKIADIFYNLEDFEDLLQNMMQAVFSGIQITEIEWHLDGGLYLPKEFHNRDLSFFALDKKNEIKYKNKDQLEDLKPYSFILHETKNTNKKYSGLFEPLAYLYVFKYYSLYDFAEFLELYGLPLRVGKFPAYASENDKAAFLNSLLQMGHNAAAIIPEGMSVEFVSPQNSSGDPYMNMIKYIESSISKLVLGQTLTSGTDGQGSYALGKVHNQVRRDLLVADAKQIAKTLTQQLIYKLIDLNFPNVKPTDLPYFEFDLKESVDLLMYSQALPPLVNIGVKFPENYINEILSIPPKADDDVFVEPKLPAGGFQLNKIQDKGELLKTEKPQKSQKGNGAYSKLRKDFDLLDLAFNNSFENEEFVNQLSDVDAKLLEIIKNSTDFEDLENQILDEFLHLDFSQHQKYLEKALAIADLIGFKD